VGDQLLFDRVNLNGAHYSNKRLASFSATSSTFQGCSFDNLRIDDAAFGAGRKFSKYVECSFDGTKVKGSGGNRARFVRCTFRNGYFGSLLCPDTSFIECVFSGTLKIAMFYAVAPPEHVRFAGRSINEFYGNDFSEAKLLTVDFRGGIDLSRQVLPNGAEYVYVNDAEAAIYRATNIVRGWSDEKRRKLALAYLKIQQKLVDGGQRQLLLRREPDDEVFNAVLDLLNEGFPSN
jgi:hypothetical protein